MDMNRAEIQVSEESQEQYSASQLRGLNDLQLAFIGGGIGDVVVN